MKVLTAYAESASGPGWANWPIWYIVRNDDGTLTEGCLQPQEQTSEMFTLYRVSAAAHEAMTAAVTKLLEKKGVR